MYLSASVVTVSTWGAIASDLLPDTYRCSKDHYSERSAITDSAVARLLLVVAGGAPMVTLNQP